MKSNYGMNGSILELSQVQIGEASKRYRLIYTDLQNRKLEVIVENLNGKFILVKSLVLEEGYVVVPKGDQKIIGI